MTASHVVVRRQAYQSAAVESVNTHESDEAVQMQVQDYYFYASFLSLSPRARVQIFDGVNFN